MNVRKQKEELGVYSFDEKGLDYWELMSDKEKVQNKITNWTILVTLFGIVLLVGIVYTISAGFNSISMWVSVLCVIGVLLSTLRIMYLYALMCAVLASLYLQNKDW